jgi:hypothetical protein
MDKLIADFGSNKVLVWNERTNTTQEFAPAEFLELPKQLEPGTRLIVENAHMAVARSKYSRAQFFTQEELEQFSLDCRQRNVAVDLFCEQQTGRARNDAGLDKNDPNDILAIHLFTEKYPHIPLKKMPVSFAPSPVRQEGQRFKDDTTDMLNIVRGNGNEGYLLDNNRLSQFIINNLNEISERLSDSSKEAFRLTDEFRCKKDCKGGKAGDFHIGKIRLPQIYSIAATLMDYDGNPRLRESTGQLPGWNFVKRHVLRMSPYHRRGGVARSNIYYWGLKNSYMPSKMGAAANGKKRGRKRDANFKIVEGSDFTPEQEQEFLQHRSTYCKAVAELFFAIKECVCSSKHQPA